MRGYNGWLLARRNQLAQFGRQYLAPDEFDRLWRARERHYRSFLAEAWLARRDDGFWKFHAKGLATVGDAIDRKALIRDAARVALGYAVSPRRLAALLRDRARPRAPGPPCWLPMSSAESPGSSGPAVVDIKPVAHRVSKSLHSISRK